MNSKKNYTKNYAVIVVVGLIAVSILFSALRTCEKNFAKQSKLEKTNLNIKKADSSLVPIVVELAKTKEEQTIGFMHRKNIPTGTGMLFIYDKDTKLSFWMKNTPTPLSIAFIDSSGKIREIFDMKPFSISPTKSTYSVRYALEVPKGWFAEHGITCGDALEVSELK